MHKIFIKVYVALEIEAIEVYRKAKGNEAYKSTQATVITVTLSTPVLRPIEFAYK